jgi:hypothetical protein
MPVAQKQSDAGAVFVNASRQLSLLYQAASVNADEVPQSTLGTPVAGAVAHLQELSDISSIFTNADNQVSSIPHTSPVKAHKLTVAPQSTSGIYMSGSVALE